MVTINFFLSTFEGVVNYDTLNINVITHKLNSYGLADKVFLLALDDGYELELIVTENYGTMCCFIEGYIQEMMSNDLVISLHEYDSYQDAYKVALDMKEESPLCYAK